jgi:hypothetical protein
MNGLLSFLYLFRQTVCPQNAVRAFCGYTISAKSHRQIYTGQIQASTSELWGANTRIGCFLIKGDGVGHVMLLPLRGLLW